MSSQHLHFAGLAVVLTQGLNTARAEEQVSTLYTAISTHSCRTQVDRTLGCSGVRAFYLSA